MKIERITGEALFIEFQEERQEMTPNQIAIRNESVTGKVYNHVVTVRKGWNISGYLTGAEKDNLLTLAAEHFVKVTINGAVYYCTMEIRSIQALETWSTLQCHKVDLTVEERGYGV